MKTTTIIMLILSTLVAIGCFDEFDDPTQSIVKKTEIIAITLNPPEAMPGDWVEATVHVADQRGRNRALSAVWLLETPTEMSERMSQTIRFEVPQLPDNMYTPEGVAPMQISVAVAKDSQHSAEDIALNAQNFIDSGEVLLGLRTLTVKRSIPNNDNPMVESITIGDKDIQSTSVSFAASTSVDFLSERQQAMAHPIEVIEDTEMYFNAVAIPALASNGLLYQWISTAGDFKARRASFEPWISPKFNSDTVYVDVSVPGANPRQDENLIPIWLIVRDDGEAHHLGTTLVEFYVRILQKTSN